MDVQDGFFSNHEYLHLIVIFLTFIVSWVIKLDIQLRVYWVALYELLAREVVRTVEVYWRRCIREGVPLAFQPDLFHLTLVNFVVDSLDIDV